MITIDFLNNKTIEKKLGFKKIKYIILPIFFMNATLNVKLIIEGGVIEVLRSIALKNVDNEQLYKQIVEIIVKLTLDENNVVQELAKNFLLQKDMKQL